MNRQIASGEYMDINARHFDPLFSVSNDHKVDCVLHMSVCFEPRKTHVNFKNQVHTTRHSEELDHLKFNIDRFNLTEIQNSIRSDWKGDLIISINGFIYDEKIVEYLNSINGKSLKSGFKVTIFQRPNVGYQWGGFYDVWQRYKTANCQYYASFEEDCFFFNIWFDRLVDCFQKSDNNIGCIGQLPVKIISQPAIRRNVPMIFMRDGRNRILKAPLHENQTKHSRGAFYFCKKECLEKMDRTYACFTHAMSNVHQIDGVYSGEVGFSQKLTACGFQLKGINICQPQELAKEGIRTKNA